MAKINFNDILSLGIELSSEKNRNRLLTRILTTGMNLTECDGGTLYVLEGNFLHFKVMKTLSMDVSQGENGEEITLPPVPLREENICSWCAMHKELMNIPDVYHSNAFDFSGPKRYDSITGYHTQSMLVLPLMDNEGRVLGVMQLLNSLDGDGKIRPFDPENEFVLMFLASQAAITLSNMLYIEELKMQMANIARLTAEKERINTELMLANKIQSDMLPNIFPAFPERGEFDIFASMNPAKEVAGDFYDFFLIDDDHLGVVVADVSGKGVPAALFMVKAKTLIRTAAKNDRHPASILREANDQLCENNDSSQFVTVWMMILEISTGRGLAANAGHEHPVRKSADGDFELVKYRHSIPVGSMEGVRFREHEFELMPGDTVFVYTDGVLEATSAENELYGDERMLAVLNAHKEDGLEPLLGAVLEDIDRFVGDTEQFDDITMVGFRYLGAAG